MKNALQERLGYDASALLLSNLRREQRQESEGICEVEEPSKALFDIERALLRSEFSGRDRERIRRLLDMNPMDDPEIKRALGMEE